MRFSRQVALSEFQIYPRSLNGGYGPKAVQMLLNVTNAVFTSTLPSAGTNVYQGTMVATATLDIRLPQPVYVTNACYGSPARMTRIIRPIHAMPK